MVDKILTWLFIAIAFVIVLPGLPVSYPIAKRIFAGPGRTNSGALGVAILLFGLCGLFGWLLIAAVGFGYFLRGY